MSHRGLVRRRCQSAVMMCSRRVVAFVTCIVFIGLSFYYLTTNRGYNYWLWRTTFAVDCPQRVNNSAVCEAMVSQGFNLNDIRYCNPQTFNNCSAIGKPFDLPVSLLINVGIPAKNFVALDRDRLEDFVFATGADTGYFHQAMDAIGNVQRFLPNKTIYFYDLSEGRSPEDVRKIQNLCGMIYRRFDFSRYPPHVRFLKNYAFKPLIVHEMLMEFPSVFWIDSSVRFHTENLTSAFDQVYENRGILAFIRSYHSNFAATHPGMYSFLPISAAAARMTEQRDANSIFFHRTKEVYNRIVVWWVLCALKEECMAAGHQLDCRFKGTDVWAGCHRFDQSTINILMAHHFHYDDQKYLSRDAILTVKRGSAHQEFLEICSPKGRSKSAKYYS